jgi:outer membrane lipoprotein carrier protein
MDIFPIRARTSLLLSCLLLLPLMASPAGAQNPDKSSAGSVLPIIRKNYNPESALSTRFTLTIFWSVREKREITKGTIALAPGNRFRVQTDAETWVSNGQTFWDYTPGSGQAVIKRLADVDQSSLPSQLFSRYVAELHFQETAQRGGFAELSWQSDSAKTPYASITIRARVQSGRLEQCVMTDHEGNTFTYVFSATEFGRKFSRETFEFAIPKSARIVDMRN